MQNFKKLYTTHSHLEKTVKPVSPALFELTPLFLISTKCSVYSCRLSNSLFTKVTQLWSHVHFKEVLLDCFALSCFQNLKLAMIIILWLISF